MLILLYMHALEVNDKALYNFAFTLHDLLCDYVVEIP